MTIDAHTLLQVLAIGLSIGSGLYAWIMSQGRVLEPRVKELTDRLEIAQTKLAELEGEMQHLPGKDDIHKLALGLKDVEAKVNTHSEVIRRVEATMQRVEGFLSEVTLRQADVQPPQPAAPPSRRRGK